MEDKHQTEDGTESNISSAAETNNESTISQQVTVVTTRADDNTIVYEAAIESTPLEKSKATANKITCISVIIVIMATILFIFSFPFSLFLILFCFNTKRSCLPFQSIRNSPWRLYITKRYLHYHLPHPPHRPYINILYCLKCVYEYRVPFEDIKSITLEQSSDRANTNIRLQSLENIIIELKPESSGVNVPIKTYFGLWAKQATVHTLLIYSVQDANTFIDKVNELINISR